MRGNADNQIKPHTIRWVDFANWAVKNIPSSVDIHLDWDPKTNQINAIYIDRDRIDEDTFVAATLVHGMKNRELKLEYFKINKADGSRKFTKRTFLEDPEHPFPMFAVKDRVLDKMPHGTDYDDESAAEIDKADDDFYNYVSDIDDYNW